MRHATAKEIQAVLKLDGPARFDHFVKRVVDDEKAWGLWKNGWALLEDSDARPVFPLWPAREYAELFRTGGWAEYDAVEIPLAELLNELLPKLAAGGVVPGVFPTPEGKAVNPSVEDARGFSAEGGIGALLSWNRDPSSRTRPLARVRRTVLKLRGVRGRSGPARSRA
jgi:hypothetical protein